MWWRRFWPGSTPSANSWTDTFQPGLQGPPSVLNQKFDPLHGSATNPYQLNRSSLSKKVATATREVRLGAARKL
jgi:hypothetical protein